HKDSYFLIFVVMKILHTSDWHLGQSFYNYSRQDEHLYFCRQLCEIISLHRPDALIVAGDIFDASLPPIAAQKLMVEMFTTIHDTLPTMTTVILAGNHDSSSRLMIHSPLWENFNVRIIASPDEPDNMIIELPGIGFIAGVPYISEFNYARYVSKDSSNPCRDYHYGLLDKVARLNTGNLPVVLTAHLAVTDSDHLRDNAARFSYTGLADLGEGSDYLALGHIHRPSTFGNGKARYSGSPIALSFDEDFPHSVTLVEITERGTQPVISVIPVKQLRNAVTLPATPLPPDETVELLKKLNDGDDNYLRIIVAHDTPLPGNMRHLAEQALDGKNYRLCLLTRISTSGTSAINSRQPSLSIDELRRLDPVEIARRYFLKKYGASLPERFERCIQQSENEIF
ncbi:MAG: exonuclease SbcCD subunit D C-terminal domain-containing protein, partial [Muribaculaceae bacterium]|nr:exonuclease SbcCD subunit D C-terminal domain-containing protein [Muribaculaceae bacterium]